MLEYDKKAIGLRIKAKRKMLGLTQDEMSERIGRVQKYCADIERGYCGMSIDTMLRICSVLNMSPNSLLFGESITALDDSGNIKILEHALMELPSNKQKDAIQMLKLFIKSV